MALAEWNERYSVGIKELDDQHRHLFEIFFTLLEADDATLESSVVSKALANLKTYTYEHFELEEEYMSKCGYPDIESHIAIHDSFREKVEDLLSAKSARQDETFMDILSSLYTWLVDHICTCDQQYAPYVSGIMQGTNKAWDLSQIAIQ
jgi:hemerythrin